MNSFEKFVFRDTSYPSARNPSAVKATLTHDGGVSPFDGAPVVMIGTSEAMSFVAAKDQALDVRPLFFKIGRPY